MSDKTNRERLLDTARLAIAGIQNILENELELVSFDQLTVKRWDSIGTEVRNILDAVSLLDTITSIDVDFDTEALPELSIKAINKYSASFGNRCYFQRNDILNWLDAWDSRETSNEDFRFDLEFD